MEVNAEQIPPEILVEADEAVLGLIPSKSKDRYEKEFSSWEVWMKEKKVTVINETVLLAYFSEKSKTYQCSSLWAKYSMIKKMLLIKKNVDISKYCKLVSFLKSKSIGHESKKANVLSKENVIKFMTEAPDDTYLLTKVALIFGIYGALRREEQANISVNDIEDRGSVLVVTIPKTKTNKKRVFTIVDDDLISALAIYKKYAALRPETVPHNRFFLQYRKGACTVQPVGKNTFGGIPKTIATYLQLPEPGRYTGHSFRRTSATLLADSGADITSIKRHGGWRSTSVAEGYLEDSIEAKNKISRSLLGVEVKTMDKAGPSTDYSRLNTVNISSFPDCPISFTNLSNCTFYINKLTQ